MLGLRTGPWKAADLVGPRQRVAGGPKRNGMQGKGDGTEKGVWLEPNNGPRGLGWHERRHRSKGRVLGARNGPRMEEDPVGPRHRVAGGPVG